MNAAEILASQGRTIPVHSVTVRLVSPSDPTTIYDAPACLRLVSDRQRLESVDAAAESLSKLKIVPDAQRRADEEAYHFLVRAVRDAVAPAKPFFETAVQAQSMLTAAEALRLVNEYDRYATTHAPQTLTAEKIAEVRKDAENFTALDLLRRHGYWNVLRLLPSLAVDSGTFQMPGSLSTGSPATS